ncbi:MAG: Gramicidin S synthase 2 [Firmicutes bacterium ADurb.Bin419]|nr:MAG: Gramicidin S synthase 2 [Firmicutes bacterium ADurb.Bin419]
MYISYQLDKNSLAYNMPFMVVLEGKIDRAKLEDSLKRLIQRHETLRTSFTQVNGEPVQIIHKDFDFKVDYINGSNKRPEEIMKDFVKAFDLGKAPLLKVGLAELEKDRYLLLADMHHIISDGISLSLFLEELSQLYSGKELEELKLQYRDFSNWQKEFLKTDRLLAQEKYWVDKFKGEIPELNMPLDYKRPLVKSYEGDVIFFEIQEDLKKQIDELARDTGGTLYIVLLAAFNILLSKYSGQEDIIVGSPVAGRPHPDLEKIIGVFINTLAMRNFPRSDLSVRKFIENVRDNSIEAFENQDFQFEKLFDTLNIQRNSNRNPLFDTMFIMQNAGDCNLEFEDIKFKLCENNYKTAKFDIKLEAFEKKQGIEFIMDYCIKLFKRKSMESFAQNYIKVLGEMVKNPEIKIGDLDVSSDNKEELINGFGDDLEGEF